MKKNGVYIAIIAAVIILVFIGRKTNDKNSSEISTQVIKEEKASDDNKVSLVDKILKKVTSSEEKINELGAGLINWEKSMTLSEANDKNTEMVKKLIDVCNDLGISNLNVYNENEFSYPTDNKIVYTADNHIINSFDEIIYTYKTINNEKYNFKLITRYNINDEEFNDNNLFDFSNMPQNEFFKCFTGIEHRDVSKINEEINKFLKEATSEYSRFQIVNKYNGIEETIVVRTSTIYYYLKTYDIDLSS